MMTGKIDFRILIEDRSGLKRFLSLVSASDGSLIVTEDRKSDRPSVKIRRNGDNFEEVPRENRATKAGAKFSIHTSGRVNLEMCGNMTDVIFIEPLYELTEPRTVVTISIPMIELLDDWPGDVPPEHSLVLPRVALGDTFCFSLGVAPLASQGFGELLCINYELYRFFLAPIVFPDSLAEQYKGAFLYLPADSIYVEQLVCEHVAETTFYRLKHPDHPALFYLGDGNYRLIAAVPMRVRPRLAISFSEPNLSAEVQGIDAISEREAMRQTYRINFWIRGRGGRIKDRDMRSYITQIELNAEL